MMFLSQSKTLFKVHSSEVSQNKASLVFDIYSETKKQVPLLVPYPSGGCNEPGNGSADRSGGLNFSSPLIWLFLGLHVILFKYRYSNIHMGNIHIVRYIQ